MLAETLRQAGVRKNIWYLPAVESLYVTDHGPVVSQGSPLTTGLLDVPRFNHEAVIKALRVDQAGESTFPEFLQAIWNAGVVHYLRTKPQLLSIGLAIHRAVSLRH